MAYECLASSFESGTLTQSALYNIFEDAVLPKCPGATKLKQIISEMGAIATLMSGSGPSVYGVFNDEISASAVAEKLKNDGYNAHYACSV